MYDAVQYMGDVFASEIAAFGLDHEIDDESGQVVPLVRSSAGEISVCRRRHFERRHEPVLTDTDTDTEET